MLIKKIGFWIFTIIAVIIINGMIASTLNLWQKRDLVDHSEQLLTKEHQKNIELKKKLKTVGSVQFIEEEARNKLFLVKKGEEIVVVAPTTYIKTTSSTTENKDTRPNWQQWWDMFF